MNENIDIEQLLDEDTTLVANKKINNNFLKINNNIELLPEHPDDADIKDMSFLKYMLYVNEIIYKNSQKIGFEYPLYEKTLSFSVNTAQKVYGPISDYFKNFSK